MEHGCSWSSLKSFWFLLLHLFAMNCVAGNGDPPYRNVSQVIRYSTLMADSIYSRRQGVGISSKGQPSVSYEHGTFQHALRELYAVTKNQKYLAWVKEGIDTVVDPTGVIMGAYKVADYNVDNIRIGESILEL
jgi:rhamnogalacturonyl hydrolase YesR